MNLRTRIIACICIISVLISFVLLSESTAWESHDVQYTALSSVVTTNVGVYFTENWNDLGRIYLIGTDGSVRYMTDSAEIGKEKVHAICLKDGNVYAMYSMLLVDSSYEIYNVYRIVKYNPQLKVLGMTDDFLIDYDEVVRYLSCDETTFYITTLEDDGESANVYSVGADDIKDSKGTLATFIDTNDEKNPTELSKPENILFRNNPGGSFFADAYYEDGMLYVLTDREVPSGKFRPDPRVSTIIDKIHFSLPQRAALYREHIIVWFVGICVWLLVVFGIYTAMQRRNRSAYIFAVTELIFFIIIFISMAYIRFRYLKIAKEENARYASLVIDYELNELGNLSSIGLEKENYLNSDTYGNLYNKLKTFMQMGDNEEFFTDVFVMRLKDGVIMTSTTGYNFMEASFIFGEGINDLRSKLSEHAVRASSDANIEGYELEAAGSTSTDLSARYALVGVYISGKYYAGLWSNTRLILILFFTIFFVGTILIALVTYLQSLDLKEFEDSIRDVALGRKRVKVPDTHAQDMKAMWASLSELEKKIGEINYDKFRIFEGYYRFAPKNIETIMGKESIFDVNNGDMTKTEGTLALVSTEMASFEERTITSLKNVISYMSQYTEKDEGILVSEDSSLSILQFLFMKSFKNVVLQATHFLHRNFSDERSGFVSVFLYYGEFIYGVVGINTQSLVFLTSRYSKEMEAYAAWFGKLKLPLVCTEDIVDREDVGQVRYIGYITIANGEKDIRLYEVLDACDAKQRQLKIQNRTKFEETLNLFYSKDFYLARNNFSEIIKECPEDSVAKWYLFECERFLNGEDEIIESGPIRISD